MLVRPHILAIAWAAALAFGSLYGPIPWFAASLIVFDWFVVNFLNRLSDVEEDRQNGVPGTTFMLKHPLLAWSFAVAALGTAFLLGATYLPAATLPRVVFHLIGFAYNFRILPGRRRFKEMPGTKNVASAVLFVISCIIVPIGWPLPVSAWWMVAFFLPLELTYELLFDVRDIEGDRATGLTTLATRYGARDTFNLMRGLILVSAIPLLVGGARLFIAGNIQQWLVVWYMQRSGATQTRVVNAVFLGAAQSLSYVLWVIFA